MLLLDIINAKGGARNSILNQRRLERLCGRVFIRLEHKLHPVGLFRRDDGEPAVRTQRNIVLQLKAKDVAIEAQRLFLVIDQNTRQHDLHEHCLQLDFFR